MRRTALLSLIPAAFIAFFLTSCTSIGSGIPGIGGALAKGMLQKSDAEDESRSPASTLEQAKKAEKAIRKSFEDITPEEEYYIGRTVGAVILDSYAPYENAEVNAYLNKLGQMLAMASSRPVTFAGYRFLALDSDEINAFAAPSGHIFVARGLLRLAEDEDMVAAILAHEIGHVVEQHGLKAIKTSRLTDAFAETGKLAAQTSGTPEFQALAKAFGGTITDITSTMVESGYSRKYEKSADEAAVEILMAIGYDPYALLDVLEAMDEQMDPEGKDFAKTHPDPEDRVKEILKNLKDIPRDTSGRSQTRQRRFEAVLGGI